jgi:predicted RNase H-like HicB family nuclease
MTSLLTTTMASSRAGAQGCRDHAGSAPPGYQGVCAGGRELLHSCEMTFTIELDREGDGRWIAEVEALPGVMCYGGNRDEAVAKVQALALRVIAERLEHGEVEAELLIIAFKAA